MTSVRDLAMAVREMLDATRPMRAYGSYWEVKKKVEAMLAEILDKPAQPEQVSEAVVEIRDASKIVDQWDAVLATKLRRWADVLESSERRCAELESIGTRLWDNQFMSPDDVDKLRARIAELEAAIKTHRDQKGDDRCWLDDRELYKAIGDHADFHAALPPKCDFLKSCERFWEQRQTLTDKFELRQMTIRQLENRIAELEAKLAPAPIDREAMGKICHDGWNKGYFGEADWDHGPYERRHENCRRADQYAAQAVIEAYEASRNGGKDGAQD